MAPHPVVLISQEERVARFGVPPPPERLLTLPDLSGVARFFSIAAFSFGMQVNLLPMHDGMREPHRAREAVGLAVAVVMCANAAVGASLAWLRAFAQSVPESWVLREQAERDAAEGLYSPVLMDEIEAQGDFEAEDVSFREELTTMPTFSAVADDEQRMATTGNHRNSRKKQLQQA